MAGLIAAAASSLFFAETGRAQPADPPGLPVSILPAPGTERAPESASVPDAPARAGASASETPDRDPASLSPLGIGLIDQGTGGFSPLLWVGSDPEEMARLVGLIPSGAPSPAMRGLIARVLFTRPAVLDGGLVVDGLTAARIEKAAQMAFIAELSDVVSRSPSVLRLPDTQRVVAEMRLIAGDIDRACEDRPDVPGGEAPALWQSLSIICLIHNGDSQTALMELDLMASRGGGDALFRALARAWASQGQPEMPDGSWRYLADPDALVIAAQRPLSRGFVTAALRVHDPARLLAIAGDPQTPPDVRLDAAERATAAGAMTPGDLARLYAGVSVNVDDMTGVIDQAARSIGPYERALLLQLADRQIDSSRAIAVRIYALELSLVRSAPLGVVLALLERLEPSPATERVAPAAVAAYLAAGRFLQAQAWLDLAVSLADTPAERAAIARLWPLRLLADDRALHPDDQRLWLDAQVRGLGETGRYSAAIALTALNALGYPVDPDAWTWLPTDDSRESSSLPGAVAWWRLFQASEAGRLGETVVLSMIALGQAGPAGAHPAVLDGVLRSLRRVGLEGEARRLAREAIWAAIR